MDWVTIIWTGTAAACLTLAAIHGFVWLRRRTEWSSLCFCLMAVATAGMASCELWMMEITEVDELGPALRWYNFFRWMVTIALVGFMHFYLRAGRTWLELTVIGLRTTALLLNLFVSPNAYYSSVDSLVRAPFLGQMVTIVEGTPNPLMLLGQVSLLVLAAYLVDTTWKGYTVGDHRRALSVGTTSVFFVLALSLQTMLVLWDVVDAPIMASLFFLGIVGAMAVELSEDMLRSARLAGDLQEREKDLLSERRLSEALFQGAPGPLFLAAPDGSLLRSNLPRAAESEGAENIQDHFSEEDRPALREALGKTVRGGSDSFELAPRRGGEPDGLHFFQTVRIEFGDEPHVVGMGVDITEPQALAMQLAEQKEHLARVSRIASMSELSSSIAHEINQPLAIILSNSQAAQRLLERGTPDLAEVSEILKDIVAADIRAAEVIRRLRAILKRGEPVLEPVQAADMVDRMLQILQPALDSAGVAVSRRIPKRLPTLQADRIAIEQVLINLVQNALEAMADNGAKGKSLAISCATGEDGIHFTVRDNGSGLPESAEKIFEAFHTTKPQGLGLGLKICNTIIASHGGRLWAENNKSRGASFHFQLPFQPAHP